MGGASSKSEFETNFGKLLKNDILPTDQVYWDELWKTSITVDDIFEIIKPNHIRKLITAKPKNLKILFTQAVAQLYQVVETPYPIYFPQALNCIRILTRLLPIILESEHVNNNKVISDMLWSKQNIFNNPSNIPLSQSVDSSNNHVHASPPPPTTSAATVTDAVTGSSLANDEKTKSNTNNTVNVPKSPQLSNSTSKDEDGGDNDDVGMNNSESEPLAVILINAMFHLLFLPDFTIENPNIEFTEKDVQTDTFKSALLWAPGIGCTMKTISSSSEYDMTRIEVLRLMLTCYCDSLYQSPSHYDNCSSFWLEVATSSEVPYAEIAFHSLLNTVLGYDPIGWGVPYGNVVVNDTAKLLMESAVQVLITILDYGYPITHTDHDNHSNNNNNIIQIEGVSSYSKINNNTNNNNNNNSNIGNTTMMSSVSYDDTESRGFNIFRRLLYSINDQASLNFLFCGFSRLLNNIPQSDNSYLPYSVTKVCVEQELLILLWKCLEEIPTFMSYILKHCDVTELMLPICYFMLSGRKDATKNGLMYLCTFCLLKLSGERSFGVALNKPYQLRLPVDIPLFTGTYADLLIIVLHKMIVSGSDRLLSLYHCFLTTICNVSPYCKGLCSVSSIKLVNLFQLFTSPQFLYQTEGNHAYVSLLLETMNNIIQYQYESNAALVYAIIKRKELFDDLLHLSLPKAIMEASNHHNKKNVKSTKKQKKISAVATDAFPPAPPAAVTVNHVTSSTANAPLETATTVDIASNTGDTDNQVTAVTSVTSTSSPGVISTVTVTDMSSEVTSQLVVPVSVSVTTESHSTENTVEDTAQSEDMSNKPSEESNDITTTTTATTAITTTTTTIDTSAVSTVLDTETTKELKSSADDVTNTIQPSPSSSSSSSSSVVKNDSSTSSNTSTTTAPNIVSNRFIPSNEWLHAVKAELPLLTITRLLKHIVPQIDELNATQTKKSSFSYTSSSSLTEAQVLNFIKSTTMVGLLPVPHPIVIRKYQPNQYTSLWFTAYQWGVVFMHTQDLAGDTGSNIQLFDGQGIKLFSVQTVANE